MRFFSWGKQQYFRVQFNARQSSISKLQFLSVTYMLTLQARTNVTLALHNFQPLFNTPFAMGILILDDQNPDSSKTVISRVQFSNCYFFSLDKCSPDTCVHFIWRLFYWLNCWHTAFLHLILYHSPIAYIIGSQGLVQLGVLVPVL